MAFIRTALSLCKNNTGLPWSEKNIWKMIKQFVFQVKEKPGIFLIGQENGLGLEKS